MKEREAGPEMPYTLDIQDIQEMKNASIGGRGRFFPRVWLLTALFALFFLQTSEFAAIGHTRAEQSGSAGSLHPSGNDAKSNAAESWIFKWDRQAPLDFRADSVILQEQEHEGGQIVVAKPQAGMDVHQWLSRYAQSGGLQYVQPNQKVSILSAPDDDFYSKQAYLQTIKAEKGWDVAKQNTAITIAVVDTGIDLDHPDLKDNLVKGVNLLQPKQPPEDDNGHGTNVAGVLAAEGNNGTGVSGLVWKTKIMPIKALDAKGQGDEERLGEGIRYAVDNGAKIVVMSVGLYRYSPYMRDIVQYAENHGVLLVSATGNDGEDVKYPAAYSTVLAVGGVMPNKRVQMNSNYGQELDVVAPWTVFTTALGGGYKVNQGTSMSAPQVAGVAALLWAKHPAYKPYQIRGMIRQSAEDIELPGWDQYSGYGLLRADQALTTAYKDDIYEPNNSKLQAKLIPADKMSMAELSGGQDADWFAFDVSYPGNLKLRLDAMDGGKPAVNVTYYGNQAPGGKSYAAVWGKAMDISVPKGKGYIRIQMKDPASAAGVVYSITTNFTIGTDPFEDNDKLYKAYLIPPSVQLVQGTFHEQNDQDWYRLNFTNPGSLRVKVTTDTMRMDPVLSLQKGSDKPLVTDRGAEGDAEFTPLMDVTPGSYYVLVKNTGGYPVTGQYTLSIEYTEKYIDPNEPNDKEYQAKVMRSGMQYVGVFHQDKDEDWFQVKLASESYVRLNIADIPDNRQLTYTLYDQSRKQLATDVNAAGTQVLGFSRILKAGTYYVRLTSDKAFQQQLYRIAMSVRTMVAGYYDIDGHWAEAAIVNLTQKKVAAGYGDHTFRPNRLVTRAEAAVWAAKLYGSTSKSTVKYKDVSSGFWAADAIARVTKAGIMEGYPNGTFAPNRVLTRQEMAVILAKALKLKGSSKGKAPYKDVPNTHWAAPYIKQLQAKGIIAGFKGGTFQPNRAATRAELASIINAALKKS